MPVSPEKWQRAKARRENIRNLRSDRDRIRFLAEEQKLDAVVLAASELVDLVAAKRGAGITDAIWAEAEAAADLLSGSDLLAETPPTT